MQAPARLRALPAHAAAPQRHQDPAYTDPAAALVEALADVTGCVSALTTLALLDPAHASRLAWRAAAALADVDREAFRAINQQQS
jgi:hypothetical protein